MWVAEGLRGQCRQRGSAGKVGSGQHCGPVQLRCSVLGRHPARPPGLAGALVIELAQCRHLRSEAAGPLPGRQLRGRSFNPTVTLLLNFILNNHKLLF